MNSNLQMYTTIAAFGGLVLGIVNLFLSLYKDFWRKGKLLCEVERADVRCVATGTFDIQINLLLENKNKPIYIKDMQLLARNKIFESSSEQVNVQYLNHAIPYTKRELTKLSHGRFEEEVRAMFENLIKIRDLKLDNQASYTFADVIYTSRLMDGYDDFPIRNWRIKVIHNYGETIVNFDFKISEKNDFHGFIG